MGAAFTFWLAMHAAPPFFPLPPDERPGFPTPERPEASSPFYMVNASSFLIPPRFTLGPDLKALFFFFVP